MTELLGKLLGRSRGLSGLELRVLDAVRALLPAPQACQWDEQVRTINKVQRLPDGVEVDFYRMKQGRPSFDEALAFPNREGELLLAIVSIVLDQAPWPSELAARVWCTRGFLFSIEYDGSSKYVDEALDMDPPPPLRIDCRLVGDLAAAR
ncbi:hypothetical protein [Chitinimonas koreensis]|uniref:hypothetical protein n=1 Tax=Chitinimonas koreensis TaxID=356302 RepID=UPI0012FBB193|nr:hypothetical protein [Chitinimonas koreensis]